MTPTLPPPDMPIPDRLNRCLVAVVVAGAVGLLWLGSHVTAWYAVLGVGVGFSYLMLTDYALLHESAHGNLQSGRRANALLGIVTGLFFPLPYHLMRTTHRNHHDHNRTDHEMFDLYYPTDSRVLKWAQWYGILCGLFWPMVPLGAVLFSVWPGLLRWRLVAAAAPSRGVAIVANLTPAVIRAIRLETLLIVGVFAGLFWLLDLHWTNTLILYACFGLNWSTRQYVGHAFSQRDVVEGAWNLRHYPWMSWVLLHGEWDLNHHRRPEVPWCHLPCLSPIGEPRIGYVRQYWRQWLGPRAAASVAENGNSLAGTP
jgi:fatty acid desaturase